MTKLLTTLGLFLVLGLAGGSLHPGNNQAVAQVAHEKTIRLQVKNMFCDACPLIVRKSLEAVPGVAKATVSFKDNTAVVTYDDAQATVAALVKATTDAGYPSAPKN